MRDVLQILCTASAWEMYSYFFIKGVELTSLHNNKQGDAVVGEFFSAQCAKES